MSSVFGPLTRTFFDFVAVRRRRAPSAQVTIFVASFRTKGYDELDAARGDLFAKASSARLRCKIEALLQFLHITGLTTAFSP
jgi:hypothetical protein